VLFEWDEHKNQQNKRKHGVRFEVAAFVFDDPWALTKRDELQGAEERWLTLGTVGSHSVLLVVHTWWEENEEEVVRIISARKANSRERAQYENARETFAN
jgi:uncharacterized DUF497 family protein